MKAIIIEEDRFADLPDLLKTREHSARDLWMAKALKITPEAWRAALDHARREMHLEFVRWAQSHGATCVRK